MKFDSKCDSERFCFFLPLHFWLTMLVYNGHFGHQISTDFIKIRNIFSKQYYGGNQVSDFLILTRFLSYVIKKQEKTLFQKNCQNSERNGYKKLMEQKFKNLRPDSLRMGLKIISVNFQGVWKIFESTRSVKNGSPLFSSFLYPCLQTLD